MMKRPTPVLCVLVQTSEVGRQVRVPIRVDHPLAKYAERSYLLVIPLLSIFREPGKSFVILSTGKDARLIFFTK
jgi:hypothetical protein